MGQLTSRFHCDSDAVPVEESARDPSKARTSSNSSNQTRRLQKEQGNRAVSPNTPGSTDLVRNGISYSPTPSFHLPKYKKWLILVVLFWVQISMNFNASVYPNAAAGISEEFDVSHETVMLGQMIFLLSYAFGCELWAPWSEEFGRRRVLIFSLCLVNVWALMCGAAKNITTVLVGRFLGGLSSAGGSVTLGVVADMWEAKNHGYAVLFVVFASVLGSVVGPVVGGALEEYFHWRTNFYIQAAFGAVVQVMHTLLVPETEQRKCIQNEIRKAKKIGVAPPEEPEHEKMNFRRVCTIWARPYKMFFTEAIVLCLSLLSGFSDALIFTFLESFKPVFSQWGFGPVGIGLAFLPIGMGYLIAYVSFFYPIRRYMWKMKQHPQAARPEDRLWWLLYLAPLLVIGLFGFAWTSGGPDHFHWIVPMFFGCLVGIANFAIYMATIDYMVAAYGPYAASATGGNGFARDFLAGISALYAGPLYRDLGPTLHLQKASTLLAGLSIAFVIPVYVFYWSGPAIRARSKFSQKIMLKREREAEVEAALRARMSAETEVPADALPPEVTQVPKLNETAGVARLPSSATWPSP